MIADFDLSQSDVRPNPHTSLCQTTPKMQIAHTNSTYTFHTAIGSVPEMKQTLLTAGHTLKLIVYSVMAKESRKIFVFFTII